MKKGKKLLSVFLSLVMMLTTVAVGGVAFAAETEDNVYFYVPECVYLAPGSAVGQYYLNSYADKDSTSLGTTDSVGKFYFHAEGATSISVAVEGATVADLTASATGDTLSDDSFTITASDASFRGLMKYTVTYVVDGETKTAVSYTYIYAPNRVPVGSAVYVRNRNYTFLVVDKTIYMGVVSFVWGMHSFDTGAYSAPSSIYLGNYGLWSQDNTDPVDTDYCGTGDPKSVNYYYGNDESDNSAAAVSPIGYVAVDVSRFDNVNEIPYLRLGISETSDKATDVHSIYYGFRNGHTSDRTYSIDYPIGQENDVEPEHVVLQETDAVTPSISLASVAKGSYVDYTFFVYCHCHDEGTIATCYNHNLIRITNNDKSDVRAEYLEILSKGYQEADYDAETWADFIADLEDAAEFLGNPEVPQTEEQDIIDELENDAEELDKIPEIQDNYKDIIDQLRDALEAYNNTTFNKLAADNYTADTYAAYSSAFDAAKDAVDAAAAAAQAAIDEYDSKPSDATNLEALIGAFNTAASAVPTTAAALAAATAALATPITFKAANDEKIVAVTVGAAPKATVTEDHIPADIDTDNVGYTFQSWDVAFPAEVDLKATVNAVYDANTYVINFDSNGGSDVDSITATYDVEYTVDDPTLDHYSFEGWYLNGTKVTAIKNLATSGEVTLVANWTPDTYNVSLSADIASYITVSAPTTATYNVPFDITVQVEEGYNEPDIDVSDGTAVKGEDGKWTISGFTGDIVISASAEIKTYEVTVSYENASGIDQGTVNYNGSFSVVITPAAGYGKTAPTVTVNGVDAGSATAAGDGTYVFTISNITSNKEVVITAIANNYGDDSDLDDPRIIPGDDDPTYGESYDFDVIVEPGYEIYKVIATNLDDGSEMDVTLHDDEAYVDGDGNTITPATIDEVTGPVEITVTVKATEYTITFNANGGEAVANKTYTIESTDTLTGTTKYGYDFKNWTVTSASGNWAEGEVASALNSKYGNITVKANWEKHTYGDDDDVTVSDGDGYEIIPGDDDPTYGDPYDFTIEVEPGYIVTDISVTNQDDDTDMAYTVDDDIYTNDQGGTYTVTVDPVTGPMNIEVTVERQEYTVDVPGEEGKFETSTDKDTYYYGEDVTVTVTLDDAYTQSEPVLVLGDGTEITGTKVDDNTWEFVIEDVKGSVSGTITGVDAKNTYDGVTFVDDDGNVIGTADDVEHGTPTGDAYTDATGNDEPTKDPDYDYEYDFNHWEPETITGSDEEYVAVFDPIPHNYNGGRTTVPATCVSTGEKEYTCYNCGYVKTVVLDIDPSNHVNTRLINVVPASCIDRGYTGDTICEDCNTIIAYGQYTALLPHTWSEWEVAQESTCRVKGYERRTCEVCGEVEIRELPLEPHVDEDGDGFCDVCGAAFCQWCGQHHDTSIFTEWWISFWHHILYVFNRLFMWCTPFAK